MKDWSRREALLGSAALLALAAVGGTALAVPAKRAAITTFVDPNCGCCHKWVKAAEAAGHPVKLVQHHDMQAVKTRLGVPGDLMSCHTSEVGGYAVEGHVPMKAIEKLLRDKPKGLAGIALPGLPAGAPGMEHPSGYKDALNVVAFDRNGGARAFSF